jgi:hypothetical protein
MPSGYRDCHADDSYGLPVNRNWNPVFSDMSNNKSTIVS